MGLFGSAHFLLRVRQASGARFLRFRHAQDGALIIFTLFLFILMLMMGGLAVDLMRYETTRTSLQQTMDRSTLAAASLTQDLEPVDVVKDYFAKAGLDQYLVGEPEVFEGLNFREVRATARANVQPFFVQMLGIEELVAPAQSSAEQRITNVEIALVLDISGSMVNYDNGTARPRPNKLDNLKDAAKEFIREVRQNDPDQRISISLVPYNGQVNLGADLLARYNVTDKHNTVNVNCVDLPAAAYSTLSLSTSLAMPNTGHVDTFSAGYTTSGNNAIGWQAIGSTYTPVATNRWCPQNGTTANSINTVRVHQESVSALEASIDALVGVGATSINAGLRWGTALLDPGSRPMVQQLINAGKVPAVYSGRPFDYTDPEAMKVIVLMTDGSHFDEERLNTGYRVGNSGIWRSSNDGNLSIYHASRSGNSKYWVPHRSAWQSTPWTNNGTAATQLTWPQVWATARLKWVAMQLYARALGGTSQSAQVSTYNTWLGTMRSQTDSTAMDAQLKDLCDDAKNPTAGNGVIVFGIAFEAPTAGANLIRYCSTSEAHYFNAEDDAQMATAFRAIASQISYLRLTQ